MLTSLLVGLGLVCATAAAQQAKVYGYKAQITQEGLLELIFDLPALNTMQQINLFVSYKNKPLGQFKAKVNAQGKLKSTASTLKNYQYTNGKLSIIQTIPKQKVKWVNVRVVTRDINGKYWEEKRELEVEVL